MVFQKIPKRLKIGSASYKVRLIDDLVHGKTKLDGLCEFSPKQISVESELHYEECESTLIHEMLHAISHEYDFNLSENTVLALERAIYETFRTNNWRIVVEKRKRTNK